MRMEVRIMALAVLCGCLCLGLTGASETERRLLQNLFHNYNLKVRPVASWEERVMVRVGMTLSQLVSLNAKNGEMTTNVFMNLLWTDYRLSWNPEEYDDIKVVRVPPRKVWRPDVYLINNNDGQFDVALYVNVLVYSNGVVTWLPPAIYRSSCAIEVAYFPFDWQNCSMVFASYTYDASEVDLQYFLDEDDKEIQEIVIDENAFTAQQEAREAGPRKPLFYVVNIIVPCILISVLAIFVFYLPPGAGEKMTLSISVLIALTVFMLLLANKVPETSLATPIIVNYVMFTMILVTFSVILSVVVLNLHHRSSNTHQMPMWVRKLQRYFDTDHYCLVLPPNLKAAIAGVTYMSEQLQKQDTDDTITGDWQYIALVVDRLFFWLFVVITGLGTLAMFLDASFNYTPDQPFP
ncbi:hypothetical protein NHX12_013601 [Muraenolepis orangiensis]|uniref:Uncharacterized protein n=1 Tax=Muraenolepis orangiensis TaxID=630683 RepID=A0A9Q0I4S9_9TELE|nr:hypothetical protein NHX12_013601 [Muraenolepis orangiensis]